MDRAHSLSSSSSVGSVDCGASADETTQAVKRRKLEDPQQEPVSPTAPSVTPAEEEDHDSVTAQVLAASSALPCKHARSLNHFFVRGCSRVACPT